jgi:hypothetical protein
MKLLLRIINIYLLLLIFIIYLLKNVSLIHYNFTNDNITSILCKKSIKSDVKSNEVIIKNY